MCVGSHEEVKLQILCQAATGAGAVEDATGAMPPAATGAMEATGEFGAATGAAVTVTDATGEFGAARRRDRCHK